MLFSGEKIVIDSKYVKENLGQLVKDNDLEISKIAETELIEKKNQIKDLEQELLR